MSDKLQIRIFLLLSILIFFAAIISLLNYHQRTSGKILVDFKEISALKTDLKEPVVYLLSLPSDLKLEPSLTLLKYKTKVTEISKQRKPAILLVIPIDSACGVPKVEIVDSELSDGYGKILIDYDIKCNNIDKIFLVLLHFEGINKGFYTIEMIMDSWFSELTLYYG